jgi:predicted XRE-type DNA-binding protein
MNKKYLKLESRGWQRGSGNTFADLGLADAEKLQAKAYLRAAILKRIAALEISQMEAARRIGVPQPKLSNLMADTAPRGFSSDKLMEFATKLGLDIRIEVRPSRSKLGKLTVDTTLGDSRRSRPHRRKTAKAA